MRNFSHATGYAVARLMHGEEIDEDTDKDFLELVNEISAFAERARVNLCLDIYAMTNAVMFAQPLVMKWQPEWKFAYAIGLSLGAKLAFDGFRIIDIIGRSDSPQFQRPS